MAHFKDIQEIIKYGTKAPSGHNTQPWKFFISENVIQIYPDFDFSLPVVDPLHRELYISLGCAGENICSAATSVGYNTSRSIKTNTNGEHIIKIILDKTNLETSDHMLQIMEKRQSNRNVYSGKTIDEAKIKVLKSQVLEKNSNVHFFKKGLPKFNTIKSFIEKGNEIQMNDLNFKDELISWIRFNKRHVDITKNGLSYKVMGSPSMPKFIGKMVVKSFLKPDKQNKTDGEKIDSSSHFVLFTSKNNTISEWISLGFSLERFLLKLTELGIANAYLNPPCEIESLSKALKKELQLDNEYPTIILRLGYAAETPYSPRKLVEEVLMT